MVREKNAEPESSGLEGTDRIGPLVGREKEKRRNNSWTKKGVL